MSHIVEINAETGEQIKREMNKDELLQLEADKSQYASRVAIQSEAQSKADAARAIAQSKLAALGLTTDDLKALGL